MLTDRLGPFQYADDLRISAHRNRCSSFYIYVCACPKPSSLFLVSVAQLVWHVYYIVFTGFKCMHTTFGKKKSLASCGCGLSFVSLTSDNRHKVVIKHLIRVGGSLQKNLRLAHAPFLSVLLTDPIIFLWPRQNREPVVNHTGEQWTGKNTECMINHFYLRFYAIT